MDFAYGVNFHRFCLDTNVTSFSWRSKQLWWEDIYKIEYALATFSLKKSTKRSVHQWQLSIANQGIRHKAWRTFSNPLSMEENISSEEDASKDSPEETIAKPLNTDGVNLTANDSCQCLELHFCFLSFLFWLKSWMRSAVQTQRSLLYLFMKHLATSYLSSNLWLNFQKTWSPKHLFWELAIELRRCVSPFS